MASIAHEVWYRRLGFCGCGCPEDVLNFIGIVLDAVERFSERMARDDDAEAIYEEFAQAIALPDPRTQMALYALSGAKLLEHGTSITLPRLTEDGAALLAFLRNTPEERWLAPQAAATQGAARHAALSTRH